MIRPLTLIPGRRRTPEATAPRTLGLVLSGGGARGAFQVGVYERLLDHPRFAAGATVLSGTSAGAINAALIAAGRSPDEMMRFWNDIADDPPVVASAEFFADAASTMARLVVEEMAGWLAGGAGVRTFLQRAWNHLRPRRGSLSALLAEYVLATRFGLVSRLLAGIRVPYLADTARLRARLVAEFRGERVPAGRHRLAINTVDAHTAAVVRFTTAETAHTHAPTTSWSMRSRSTWCWPARASPCCSRPSPSARISVGRRPAGEHATRPRGGTRSGRDHSSARHGAT